MGVQRVAKALFSLLLICLIISCDSRLEEIIPDNDSFSTTGISKIKIENYVNRLFIDLIGREPTDIEQSIEADTLNKNNLSEESRLDLIYRLMEDTSFSINEGSYQEAFSLNLYLLAKIRCMEGVSDAEIRQMRLNPLYDEASADSLAQDWENYYKVLNEIKRYELMLRSAEDLRLGLIKYHEMYAFMIDNALYDMFNMNTFNFVRASFDQLLFRIPTEQEYDQAFDMVENNLPNELLGQLGNSKADYINILINSVAMKEGMIRWAFQVFLQREGTPDEIASLLEEYKINENINDIIAKIVVTDEYANFY
jgi:hypothetical protein